MRGLLFKEFGNPKSVLTFSESLVKPQVKSNEVLVKILASPINPSDVNQIEGVYPVLPFKDSDTYTPGNEGSGRVVEVGNDVSGIKSGDHVIFAAYAKGTWREYVCATAQELIKVDARLDPKNAAILSVNPCSAYRMLRDFGDNKVLIQNAANSGVGQMVIQMAKLKGFKTINIIRDRPNVSELKQELTALGADFVYTDEELETKETTDFIKNLKPTLALNAVGGKSATNISRVLDQNGQMVTYGAMSKQPVSLPVGLLIFKNISFKGFWMTQWSSNHSYDEKRAMIEEIQNLAITGALKFPKVREFHIRNFHDAFEKGDKALFTWEDENDKIHSSKIFNKQIL
eukprot:NODE_14_length_42432_cov_0.433799.p12 type:complete len:344 gc:universal NODE_14_length_42432_cov_0.433799:9477-10508(+)